MNFCPTTKQFTDQIKRTTLFFTGNQLPIHLYAHRLLQQGSYHTFCSVHDVNFNSIRVWNGNNIFNKFQFRRSLIKPLHFSLTHINLNMCSNTLLFC
jgi:hypothetical protein